MSETKNYNGKYRYIGTDNNEGDNYADNYNADVKHREKYEKSHTDTEEMSISKHLWKTKRLISEK